MFKKTLSFLLALMFVLLFSCAGIFAETNKEILVSAAISLKDVFEETGRLFEANHEEVKVRFNFGASGSLARQIESGAPVDVFASASPKDMDDIAAKGLILPDSRKNFAGNAVVLVRPSKSRIQIKSFNDLLKSDVKKVAIGNPGTVPAGRYAEEVLKYFKVYDALKEKYVFAENVRQVLGYVALGEVEAGIVYATDALSMPKDIEIAAEAPEESHKPVIYPIAAIKSARNETLAREFINLIASEQGKKILEKYGFKTFP